MNKFRFALLTALLAVFALGASAQMQEPVHVSVQQKQVSPTEVDVIFTAKIDNGWHVYSTGLPSGGPISATVTTEKAEGAQTAGKLQAKGKELSNYDKLFEMKLRYFENAVSFVQRYKITGKTYHIKGYLEYGACNDQNCLPPTQVEFDFKGNGPANAPDAKETKTPAQLAKEKADSLAALAAANNKTEADTTQKAATTAVNSDNDNVAQAGLWAPVVAELQAYNGDQGKSDNSIFYIFAMGFIGGLLALFTPCVWPIIPMTVSFFLKRSQNKAKGIRDALTYGVSIIVIYVALGLAVTAAFGPSALNSLSTNAVFNILFCLLLIVFALSFFGWFEIRLPDKWGNAVDSKASSTSGILSIFLMAFTLALVSFSCTGPIIGFLLVQVSTSGSIMGPGIGMLGFAVALALPDRKSTRLNSSHRL